MNAQLGSAHRQQSDTGSKESEASTGFSLTTLRRLGRSDLSVEMGASSFGMKLKGLCISSSLVNGPHAKNTDN